MSNKYTFRDWCIDNGKEEYLVNTYNGDIDCSGTEITSLEGAPKTVNGKFDCSFCGELTSLEGAPREVGKGFFCYGCDNLTSLEGAPREVDGFFCYGCDNLTSLEGAPREVDGFFCYGCDNLTSLKGAPEVVSGDFNCIFCNNLTSLEGAEKYIGKIFNIMDIDPEDEYSKSMMDNLIMCLVSDLLNGKYNVSYIKDLKKFKKSILVQYNSFKLLLDTLPELEKPNIDLESKCMKLANKMGYDIIPDELRKLLLSDIKPFEKMSQ